MFDSPLASRSTPAVWIRSEKALALFRFIILAALAAPLIIGPAALAGTDRDKVDALNQQMMQLYGQGRFDEATPLAQHIVTLLEKALGPDNAEVASSINNLAELYSKQQRFSDAEPLYQRCLSIRLKLLGPTHPDVVKSINRLADLYRSEGREADATALLDHFKPHPAAAPPQAPQQRAQPQHLPPSPATLAAIATNKELERARKLGDQATQLTQQGHYAEALTLAGQVPPIIEKALGPDHPNLAVSLMNLAQINLFLEHFETAEALYKRSLPILEKAQGPNHPNVGYGLCGLADLYARQKRFAEALPLYQRGEPIVEKSVGAANPNIKIMLSNLAEIERQLGKDPENDPILKGRVPPRMGSGPNILAPEPHAPAEPADLDRANRLDQQIYDLVNQKKPAEALPVALELQTLTETMYGADSLAASLNLDRLANLYKALGRESDAAAAARRSQEIRDHATMLGHAIDPTKVK